MEYFKDYYIGSKYIGSLKSEKDRDIFGFYGRKNETTETDILLSNNKKIKSKTQVITELQILCVKK